MADVEKTLGHKTMFLETDQFLLVFDIPEIKVKRRIYQQHAAMHLYAERATELIEETRRVMGMKPHDLLGTRHQIYMFERQKDAKALAPVLTSMPIQSGQRVSRIGSPGSALVSWDDPEKISDDEDRHQYFVHAFSHHVHNDVREYKYWLFQRYGWVYEGLAYFQEIRQFGTPKMNCSAESVEGGNWKGKSWEANVKKALTADKAPSVADVLSKGVSELTDMERQFAWSYIDYLMWEDPNKMPELLRLMKGPQLPTRDCLKAGLRTDHRSVQRQLGRLRPQGVQDPADQGAAPADPEGQARTDRLTGRGTSTPRAAAAGRTS